jgi:hypothetical protein
MMNNLDVTPDLAQALSQMEDEVIFGVLTHAQRSSRSLKLLVGD